MTGIINLALIITALAAGHGENKESKNQDITQHLNPNPQVLIADAAQQPEPAEYQNISYGALVDLVRENGGKLEADLLTTQVIKANLSFSDYSTCGIAWAGKMKGVLNDNILIEMSASDFGADAHMEYKGGIDACCYGWTKSMQGSIGGNKFELDTTKVEKRPVRIYPYGSYGHAWSGEMAGRLGNEMRIIVKTLYEGSEKLNSHDGIGGMYGFAWADKATITIKLKE